MRWKEPQTIHRLLKKQTSSAAGLPTIDSADYDMTMNLDSAESPTADESQDNRKDHLPHDQPRVARHERSRYGTSTIPEVNRNVHPKMKSSSGLRLNAAVNRRDTNDNGTEKHHNKSKKRKNHSRTKDPADSGSPIIVGGVIGGILMLMFIVTSCIQLCKYCRKRSAGKRGDPEQGLETSSSADQVGNEASDEEIIFERKASGNKKGKSKKKQRNKDKSSATNPKDTSPGIQSTDTPTARDIPLTSVSTATGSPSTEVWINMEASDSTLPESLSSTSALSEPLICTPNVTPQSTPLKSCSRESLSTPQKSSSSESDILTHSKEPNLPALTKPTNPSLRKM
ncbi:hypothetical protein OS493_029562 [Desmophyllum pertusum]|uniref:Uncharacterized protein n=1 Tax=Desmophyllum pertusum TaxID=174260 RepID=A0A9W9ZZ03_9CNID|nr:hypothetical protein OS493_029562 [Desmophyllum pertusum]